MSRERTLDEQLIMLRLAARVDPLLREAVADVDDAVATLTTRAEQAEARVAALTAALGEAVSWMEATNDYESLSPVGHALTRDAIQKARAAMEETR